MDYLPYPRGPGLHPQSESWVCRCLLCTHSGSDRSPGSLQVLPVCPSAADCGPLLPWMPLPTATLMGTRTWCKLSSRVGRDGPLWVSSGQEKASRHKGHQRQRSPRPHSCLQLVLCPWVQGAVRQPGGRPGSPGERVPGTGTGTGQPLSSGCLLPAAPWRTGRETGQCEGARPEVQGDRPGWTRGPPGTSPPD